MTTAQHLRTIARHWQDLHAALAADTQTPTWPPATLRHYLAALEQHDPADALALRALERDPGQLGARPTPIRPRIYDAMRTIEAALVELADQAAAALQRPPMGRAPETWPITERERHNALAAADAADPRRWGGPGRPRTAPHAALWLLALVEGHPGPWAPLNEAQHAWIHDVAAEAARRLEHVLDLCDATTTLAQSCACGGEIVVHGGAGAAPLARCGGCGTTWHLPETAVA